ncbi:RnfABCDGE type electron transport complex subunit D [Paludicola sp. MB14-C6]|uniref:RnfABCDGE type electron transport complex subunit D n=1 Tax=Paludihabitans sp. MB14-C6 TaxID=3070656 RepID=UPI0027DD1EFD|nr:RnfABCDGE type electron transport complex subunit D [Paludicola sp. MB14-C6]WMJ23306.1 RnfABCDGE type electron transport complex subunit D [Paludicola sp. MB14-C6]
MNKLVVSPSPHILSKNSTSNIMFDVIIALFPALIAGIFFFGPRALIITLVCVASCVGFEYLTRKLMKRSNTISDLSAAVTGILLAFNLPPAIPIWVAILGSFFAIVIVKQMFGGIGQNFANPAIAARIILLVSFSTYMTTWAQPFGYKAGVDAIANATPLVNINSANTLDLFLGNVPGCIGEVSALALLIGGVYLVIRKVINPIIPITFIGTVFVLTWVMGENPVNHIFAGGLMIGAIFMATDYSTSPSTFKGKIIFAVGCGLITSVIRVFGSYPEGVSYAILLMNLVTPLIDRYTKVRPVGVVRGAK